MSIGQSKLSVILGVEPDPPCLGHLKNHLNCKTARVVPPEHIIFSQDESPHTVCLICNGLVKLTRTESGGRPVIVGLRRPGWLLGVGALLPGRSYASTAETVIRSKLCFVSTEKLNQEMETNARFSQWIAMLYSRELYSSMINLSERSCLSGKQRLEKFLLNIVQDQKIWTSKKAVKIQIPLKHWEMAQLLGLTAEHLSRLIKQMENEGIVSRENGWLVFRNPTTLDLRRS